jgi:hypothetical protein
MKTSFPCSPFNILEHWCRMGTTCRIHLSHKWLSKLYCQVHVCSPAPVLGQLTGATIFGRKFIWNSLRTCTECNCHLGSHGAGIKKRWAWLASRGGYQTSGSIEKRALRYVIGLIGIIILWYGLGQVFPRGETWIPLTLRYIRYTLVGLWVTAGAPWLFFHFKLVRTPKI